MTAPGLTLADVYARLRDLAPEPDPESSNAAQQLAVSLLGAAQRRFTLGLEPGVPLTQDLIAAACGQFAALHLLQALECLPEAVDLSDDSPADIATAIRARLTEAAREILYAWEDGGGIGEWLWEHGQRLGVDTAKVARLAEAEAALRGAETAQDGPVVATGEGDGKLTRDLRGLIRHWRAESARWDGFTVEGDAYRNGGFAERSARYAACANAVEAVLAECALYDAETARDGTEHPGEDERMPEVPAAISATDIMDAIRDMAAGEFEDAIREGTDRLLAERLPAIEAAVRAGERQRILGEVGAFWVYADEDGELHLSGPCADTLGCLYGPGVGSDGRASIADLILAASAHTGMAAGQLHAALAVATGETADGPDNAGHPVIYSSAVAPGGWVCAVPVPGNPDDICGHPVESEPCPEHRGDEWRPE